jgi:Lrp/AsnC family transcriptional regulator for asnA, asnC and gidA
VAESVAAARWLRTLGVSQLYFKYCSTFDSTDAGNIGPVADALAELSAASYVVVTAGVYDLLVEVVCADDRELLDLVDTIRATPGVRETETMTYLDIRNETYNWGTR